MAREDSARCLERLDAIPHPAPAKRYHEALARFGTRCRLRPEVPLLEWIDFLDDLCGLFLAEGPWRPEPARPTGEEQATFVWTLLHVLADLVPPREPQLLEDATSRRAVVRFYRRWALDELLECPLA